LIQKSGDAKEAPRFSNHERYEGMEIKKLIILSIVLAKSLCAAPVGNTSAPALIEKGIASSYNSSVDFRLGYEGDFVSDGRMKQKNSGGRVDCYEGMANSVTATCNIQDRMDLYGVFGVAETEANWRFENPSEQIVRIKLDTHDSFLWAAGLRMILVEWGKASLGFGGRYSASDYSLSSLSSNSTPASTEGAQFQWREWQINLDMSYKIHLFTPYIGAKYSHARTQLNHFSVPISSTGNSNEFKNRDPVGLYLGCGLSTGKYFMLNIEGRLIDEEAITLSADIRF
jgi:opacity protein-like surface antigen